MSDHKDPTFWREQYWNVDRPPIEPSVPPATCRCAWWTLPITLSVARLLALVIGYTAFGFAMAMIWAGAL